MSLPRKAEKCRFCDGTGHPVDEARLGPMLRRMRENLGLSLAAVAERTGRSKAYLSRLERGEERARRPFVQLYCEALVKAGKAG